MDVLYYSIIDFKSVSIPTLDANNSNIILKIS